VFVSSDASPGTMPRQGSQAGFFVFLADPELEKEAAALAPVCWSSHRLKRVARSSLAVEAMGVCEGLEAGEHVRCCLEELRNPAFEVKTWETAAQNTRLIIATDAQSLYDHVNKDAGMPKDRIFALDVASLKHYVADPERNASLRWIPGKNMVADGLTKYLAVNDLMLSVLTEGWYSLMRDGVVPARAAEMKEKCRERQKQKKRKESERKLPHQPTT